VTESPSILGDPRWIAWKLEESRMSRGFKRFAGCLAETPLRDRDREILLAILLVEMTARPTLVRMLEWALALTGRWLALPVRWLPSTLGPFQMRDAPFAFQQAARVAAKRIEHEPYDAVSLARSWHGAAGRERGARVGYADALRIALGKVRQHDETGS
jgi:hypothetical protein